ncbi:hypothetical protein SRRS_53710 [Sporomusa rhizae]|uniref:hypothetical protein n=1 Tax=Sporomusa rhizae TaxID=357999 RepID=UPI00352A1CC9
MKDVKKKIMVFSMLGLMQAGLFTGVASASPRYATASDPSSFFSYLMQCCEDIFCQKQCSDLQTDCEQVLSEKGRNTNNFYLQFQKKCNK